MFNSTQNRTDNQFFGGRCGGGFRGHRGGWGEHFARKMQGFRRLQANIEESGDNIIISLYAAGLVKENISLKVQDDILTVAYKGTEQKGENETAGNSFTHQEFTNSSFERSFALNNKVLTDQISAGYSDGILKVTLPKNPETNKPAQNISVK